MQGTPAFMYLVLAAESLKTAAPELRKNLAPDMLKTFALAPEFLQNLTLELPKDLVPELVGKLAPELLKRTEALAMLAHEVCADIVVMLGPGLNVEALHTSVRTAVVEGLAQNEGAAQRRIAAAARRAAVRGVLKTVVEAVVTVCVVRAGSSSAPGWTWTAEVEARLRARLEELCAGIEDVVIAAGALFHLNGIRLTECGGPIDIYEQNPVAFEVASTAAGIYAPGIMFVLSALGAGGKDTIAVALDRYISRKIPDKRVKAKL